MKKAEIVSLRPDDTSLPGNVKVTRQDWLNTALDLLVSDGVDKVKVLSISERLQVSRSSFYWYFKSRRDLLDGLLKHWEDTNTQSLVAQCALPSATITEGVCNLFCCFIDSENFNVQLDSAVRQWSRQSGAVRRIVDRADATRMAAIQAMFERHDYPSDEAEVRARILYYMQIGYNAVELSEPLEERLKRVPGYLLGFTGQAGRPEEIAAFACRSARKSDPLSGEIGIQV
ncbi:MULTISPECIES: TetR/AcrR family transcriptional regulator [unclassified Roseitalea]|uniref:TetR/AcrR family transcriptional regulator n=1 Tax=unclassified Roseitalea TaxID=2639107 RepID=UPI00273DBF6A|nr:MULTISPECIES: TetR/AcrR family transcriptional regulator [unclassified Roseitalea]